MLRRAHLVGLLVAVVAVPVLAADFTVNGNVNVAGQQGAPGNLTVNGQIVFPQALNVSPLIVVPTPTTNAVPVCNMDTLGQVGTGFFSLMSKNEYDAVLWFCGLVTKNSGQSRTPQLYVLKMQWWPTTSSARSAAPGAGADAASLAARVATLERQLRALKTVTCRDHASEPACR